MTEFLSRWFSLPRFDAAVRLSIYDQMTPLAERLGLDQISAYIERAQRHDRETSDLERRWAMQTSKDRHGLDLVDLEPLSSRLLWRIREVARGYAIGAEAGDPLIDRVAKFLDALYPAGVSAISGLPHQPRAHALRGCVDKLQGPLAPMVDELGLRALVSRLQLVTDAYHAAVEAGDGRISFRQIYAARKRGHRYLLELIAMIVAHFHDSDNLRSARARSRLLAPISEHAAIARAALRAQQRRRARFAALHLNLRTDNDSTGAPLFREALAS